MAAYKSCKMYLDALSGILDKKSLDYLAEKHEDDFKSKDFIKDVLEVIYNSDTFGENNNFVCLFVERVPVFPYKNFLEGFKDCLLVLVDGSKDTSKAVKLCKIVLEVLRGCPLFWLLQIEEGDNMEMLDLEKPQKEIVDFLLFLLKQIDLMPLSANELASHPKLALFPVITVLCHSILRRVCENTTGIPDRVSRNFQSSILKKLACNAIMVAAQQTGRYSWVSENARKAACDLIEFLTYMCGYCDTASLLSGSDEKANHQEMEEKLFPNGLLGNILKHIKNFAAKDKLVELPVVIYLLVWSIKQVKHPYLGQHISLILPPLLLLLDDFRVSNRITGIKALEHLIENMNATELCWYGRAEVIYEALHHHIHTNEPEIMNVLQPCLLKILKVIEPSPKKPIAGRKMNRCDRNFQIILTAMEFESKIAMRRAYCSHLVQFIDHMGITVLRHFKRLLRVVFAYMETPDGDTEEWRLTMLDVLKTIITVAWPRMPSHADQILRNLLKLLIDCTTSSIASGEVKQNMLAKIEECLLLLLFCCGDLVEKQLKTIATNIGHTETETLVSNILNAYHI